MQDINDRLDGWRYRNRIPDQPLFISELSRYKHYNPEKISISNGDSLVLRRDRENKDDPNAIEMRTRSGLMLGFLPREISLILAPVLDGGEELNAYFHAETRVAGGMVVVGGEPLRDVWDDLDVLGSCADMDTNFHLKKSAVEINVDWYDQNAELYDRNANRCNPKDHVSSFISQLPPGARILDAGCGNGRDMETFKEFGFDVHGFDASRMMCGLSAQRVGASERVRQLSFSQYADPTDSWDGIWAMASLVHVEDEDIGDVVHNLTRSLRPGGIFFAALKIGEENAVTPEGRRMAMVNEEKIRELFVNIGDLRTQVEVAKGSGGVEQTWLNVVLTKAPELVPEMEMAS